MNFLNENRNAVPMTPPLSVNDAHGRIARKIQRVGIFFLQVTIMVGKNRRAESPYPPCERPAASDLRGERFQRGMMAIVELRLERPQETRQSVAARLLETKAHCRVIAVAGVLAPHGQVRRGSPRREPTGNAPAPSVPGPGPASSPRCASSQVQ